MDRRLLVLVVVVLAASCDNGNRRTTVGRPPLSEKLQELEREMAAEKSETTKPSERAPEGLAGLNQRIDQMSHRWPGDDINETPPRAEDLFPTAPTNTTPDGTSAETGTPSVSVAADVPQAEISDVIASLEARAGLLTQEEQFELSVLRALKKSRNRSGLLPELYPKVDRGYRPTWHVLTQALDSCATGNADETLARLREAEAMLVGMSSVRIESPVFCERIDRFGDYKPLKSASFKRGGQVLVYLEVADFEYRKKGALYEYHLSVDASLLPLDGRGEEKLDLNTKTGAFTTRSRIERQYYPLKFRVPEHLYAGDYVLRITITDQLKKQFTEERLEMKIR
jgi:hypothetical protein